MLKRLYICCLLVTFSAQALAANKQLIGHFFEWNGQINKVQTDKITHFVYNHFNLTANADIEINHPELAKPNFIALKQLKKQRPELIMLASIGGWALSKHYPEVVASKAKRNQLVQNIGHFITNSDFDGISIDWRYPGISRQSTVGQRNHDGEYLLHLLQQIRQTYPEMPLIVTVSVLVDDLAYLPVFELSQTVDFVEVLTLDLAGHWQNHTGHAAPLYTPTNNPSIFTGSVNESITYLLKRKVPANKLIISIPAFGHGWMGAGNINHGLFQPSASITPGDYPIKGHANKGLYRQQSIHALFFSENYQSYWDNQAKASYLFNDQTGHFVSFESTRSLKAKINYIKQNGLSGISVQNLDADASLTEQAFNLLKQTPAQTRQYNWPLAGFLLLSLVIVLLLAFVYLKKHKQTKMTQEFIALKQKLEQLTVISEAELVELQQQLASKQQKYRLKSQDLSISAQLLQMMSHLGKLIQQLSNDPSLLSELHKISSNKSKLLYVQAEKGYTGLYLHNQTQPEYIYSRLKQLKQYYDDDFLIQTHRSYLVNVQKVEHIKEQSDGKFFVTIGQQTLPIGGSFIKGLKQQYPHWFLPS